MPRPLIMLTRARSMPEARRAVLSRIGRLTPAFTFAAVLLAGCQSYHPTPATVVALPDQADAETASEPVVPAVARAAPVEPGQPGACCLRADLWERMRAGFKFDLAQDNPRIAAQRNWYLRNPQYLDRVIARGSRYMHYIVEEAEARDMPLELALLPVVESAFDPYAYSVAHAAGPWQFIPSTGRIYGLKQTWWYDGRRDILLSTRAALDYLERLANRFDGDYEKALASYNAGAGTVSRAITRNIRAGKPTDYWSLKVPQETSAYVPKLIALAQIVADPQKYGVRLNPVPDEPRFTEVKLDRPIDLARAAELAGMPLTELYLYNPGHSRWLSDPQGPHRLLLPIELADNFRAALAAVPDNEYAVAITHEVAEGETLAAIATRYNVAVDAITALNNLSGDTVSRGETLTIPQPRLVLASNDTTYEPRIVALNGKDLSKRGDGSPKRSFYTVRRGDTLSKIARQYKVSPRDLARWNDRSIKKPLKVGERLAVHSAGGGGGGAKAVARSTAGSGDKRVNHKVKRGDTLHGLARKFKVSVHDIARWNDFSPKRQLRVGESVKLYLD